MEISSIDVERKSFDTVRKGGFDRGQVEEFLAKLSALLFKLESEISMSRRQISSLDHQLAQAHEKADEGSRSFLFAVELKQKLIAEAEARAAEILKQAHAEAGSSHTATTGPEAGSVEGVAEDSRKVLDAAHAEAQSILDSATAQADAMVSEAESGAARLRADAARLLDEASRAVDEARQEGLETANSDTAAMLETAKAQAAETTDAAASEAEETLSAAQSEAEQTLASARSEAETLAADASAAVVAAEEMKAAAELAASTAEQDRDSARGARERAEKDQVEAEASSLEAEQRSTEAQGHLEEAAAHHDAVREEAAALLAAAGAEADNLNAAVARQAERMRAAALAERNEVVGDARTEADSIRSDANSEAESILEQARARFGRTNSKLGALDARIDRIQANVSDATKVPGAGVDADVIVSLRDAQSVADEVEAEIWLREEENESAEAESRQESRYARRSAGLPHIGREANTVLTDMGSLRRADEGKGRRRKSKG